jgi:UDP-glucuronate 4-epimerase
MQKMKKKLLLRWCGLYRQPSCRKLLAQGWAVTVVDNFDAFYPRETKMKNMSLFINDPSFKFIETDILNETELDDKLTGTYDAIVHLRQSGVRPSIENPVAYQDVNVKGTQNLLEFAKEKESNNSCLHHRAAYMG